MLLDSRSKFTQITPLSLDNVGSMEIMVGVYHKSRPPFLIFRKVSHRVQASVQTGESDLPPIMNIRGDQCLSPKKFVLVTSFSVSPTDCFRRNIEAISIGYYSCI
jgi:hypothetical protein